MERSTHVLKERRPAPSSSSSSQAQRTSTAPTTTTATTRKVPHPQNPTNTAAASQGKGTTATQAVPNQTAVAAAARDHSLVETSLARPFEEQEAQVLQAAALVAEEIRSGAWPCGYSEHRKKQRPSDAATAAADKSVLSEVAMQAYRNQLAAMLEMFAREIVLPSIVSASSAATDQNKAAAVVVPEQYQPQRQRSSPPNPEKHRAFLGALIAIREVMTQNAEMFFGGKAINESMEQTGEVCVIDLQDDDEDVQVVADPSKEGSKDPPAEGVEATDSKMAARNISGEKAHGEKQETQRLSLEERLYGARLLATGVILSATLRLQKPGQVLHDELVRIIDAYDTGSDEFASCLDSADGNWRGVLPNGSCLHRDETVAWKASYDRARDEHPLIIQSKRRKLEKSCREANTPWNREPDTVMVAKPNLCFAGVVEDLTAVMLQHNAVQSALKDAGQR